MASVKDRRFPIIFMIVAIVLTFGVLLINSLSTNITGHAVGSSTESAGSGISFAFAIPWILLIVFALVVGVFILKGHGKQK